MKNLYLLGLILPFLSSCSEFKKGEGELLYNIHKDAQGQTIKENDMIAISLIEKTEDDSVITSTYDADNRPVITFRTRSGFKGDFNTALGLLSEGDSATFKISANSLIAANLIPVETKGKYIIYQVRIDKVLPRTNESDIEFTQKFESLRLELANREKQSEAVKIKRFLQEKHLNPEETSSGLLYMVEKTGNGPKPLTGDSVYANYTGMYLSGKPYKTTYDNVAKKGVPLDPVLPVPAGKAEVFSGLDEVLTMFPQGTKVKAIFPSKLAYGAHFHQGIEPFTPLLWDIEITEIRRLKR